MIYLSILIDVRRCFNISSSLIPKTRAKIKHVDNSYLTILWSSTKIQITPDLLNNQNKFIHTDDRENRLQQFWIHVHSVSSRSDSPQYQNKVNPLFLFWEIWRRNKDYGRKKQEEMAFTLYCLTYPRLRRPATVLMLISKSTFGWMMKFPSLIG